MRSKLFEANKWLSIWMCECSGRINEFPKLCVTIGYQIHISYKLVASPLSSIVICICTIMIMITLVIFPWFAVRHMSGYEYTGLEGEGRATHGAGLTQAEHYTANGLSEFTTNPKWDRALLCTLIDHISHAIAVCLLAFVWCCLLSLRKCK